MKIGGSFYAFFYFFHVDGANNNKIGKISNRPISISIDNTSLAKIEYPEKLLIGPTELKPGPILLNVAVTAEKFVSKSNPSKLTISKERINITKYAAI